MAELQTPEYRPITEELQRLYSRPCFTPVPTHQAERHSHLESFSTHTLEPWSRSRDEPVKSLRRISLTSKPDYPLTFFKLDKAGNADAIIQSDDGFPDTISIMASSYSFPANVICQAVARVLSEDAAFTFRNFNLTTAVLEYLRIQHQFIQLSAVHGVSNLCKFPSVLTTIVIVDQESKIKEVLLCCSPDGSIETRNAIRDNRSGSFRGEMEVLFKDWEARKVEFKEKLKLKRDEIGFEGFTEGEVQQWDMLNRTTNVLYDPTFCAEPEVLLGLRTKCHSNHSQMRTLDHRTVFYRSAWRNGGEIWTATERCRQKLSEVGHEENDHQI